MFPKVHYNTDVPPFVRRTSHVGISSSTLQLGRRDGAPMSNSLADSISKTPLSRGRVGLLANNPKMFLS